MLDERKESTNLSSTTSRLSPVVDTASPEKVVNASLESDSAPIFAGEYFTEIHETHRQVGLGFCSRWSRRMNESTKIVYNDSSTIDNNLWKILYLSNPIKFCAIALSAVLATVDTACISISFALNRMKSKSEHAIFAFLVSVIMDFCSDIICMVHLISSITQQAIYAIASPLHYVVTPFAELLEEVFGIPKETTYTSIAIIGSGAMTLTYFEITPLVAAYHALMTPQNIALVTNSTFVAMLLYCLRYWSNNDLSHEVDVFTNEPRGLQAAYA